ncbi:MAG TPA: hypothetical protein VF815_06580 [Myxococcaceae bacterium]|jgi:hypothetical protein
MPLAQSRLGPVVREVARAVLSARAGVLAPPAPGEATSASVRAAEAIRSLAFTFYL